MAQGCVDYYGIMGIIELSSGEEGESEGMQATPEHPEEPSSSDWGWDPAVQRRWNREVRDVSEYQEEREERVRQEEIERLRIEMETALRVQSSLNHEIELQRKQIEINKNEVTRKLAELQEREGRMASRQEAMDRQERQLFIRENHCQMGEEMMRAFHPPAPPAWQSPVMILPSPFGSQASAAPLPAPMMLGAPVMRMPLTPAFVAPAAAPPAGAIRVGAPAPPQAHPF
jgi:hypothetical protein